MHSLNELAKEGATIVCKDDIIDKAYLLYLTDAHMTEVIDGILDRQFSKVLEDSHAWKTLVKPVDKRKGQYSLNL